MNEAIRLRPALPEDVAFLLRLRKLTMTAHLQKVGEPTDDAAHHRRIQSNFDDAVILCDGAERIGLLKMSRGAEAWHIHQIQVLPTHQGKGVGTNVLLGLLDRARQQGVPVSLNVLHGNPARRLYERLGFTVVSQTTIDVTLRWFPS